MSDLAALDTPLLVRSNNRCELCGATDGLSPHPVLRAESTLLPTVDTAALLCGTCAPQLDPGTDLDIKHWYCLQESAWSLEPPVQVIAWRLLQRLRSEGWARDLLEQLYIDDDVLAWAQEGVLDSSATPTVDSNGVVLADGDSVTIIKSLDVKGAGFTAKRGTLVRNIRLGDDPELIQGKVEGVTIFLKTCFLKKSG